MPIEMYLAYMWENNLNYFRQLNTLSPPRVKVLARYLLNCWEVHKSHLPNLNWKWLSSRCRKTETTDDLSYAKK